MIPLLLLLLVGWQHMVSAGGNPTECPVLPSVCHCTVGITGKISVSCDGVYFKQLVKDLGSLPIEKLHVSNSEIPALAGLPTGPIQSLEMVNCNMKTLDVKAFSSLSASLEELVLVNNSLTAIPPLVAMAKLTTLSLGGNKLTGIEPGAFNGMPSLRNLRLKSNRICSLSSDSLRNLTRLELIDLSGNCLSLFPADSLRGSGRLMYLDLSDNKISQIEKSAPLDLEMLRELRINNNQLTSIHPEAMMNLPQLEFLHLRNNRLTVLDGDIIRRFRQLAVLDASDNKIQKPPVLRDFPNLQQVLLEGNNFQAVEQLTFSNNPRLQLINLQNNRITRLSKNSFDALDQMIILLLGNNSLTSIERGMFDGLRSLQQLSLRNNSMKQIDGVAFNALPELSTLDVALNKLSTLDKDIFSHQSKMFWLDVSSNSLSGFEKDTFKAKIANILLDDNHFICDEKFDWFVQYLVAHQVRTFLPFQSEITCEGPSKYAGTKLKDLMMKKANETIAEGMKTLGLDHPNSNERSLITSFIPGLNGVQTALTSQTMGNVAAGIPFLSTITQAIPSLRNLPGMESVSSTSEARAANGKLNSAIEQFAAPLVRFATGGQPVASDIEQLIQSIPNFVVNVPGMGDIDISQLDPNFVAHILRGGQIPGIAKETLDQFLQNFMNNMYEAATASLAGKQLTDQQKKFLPPVDKLPQQMIGSVMQGSSLPGLNQEKTKAIKDYYTRSITSGPYNASESSSSSLPNLNNDLLDMMKMLPNGYNISKIPMEIISSVAKGEMPDLKQLPKDLMEHFMRNSDQLAKLFNKVSSKNSSIKDILTKLPKFDRPIQPTFSPYDINELTSEMIHKEEKEKKAATMRMYSAILLGVIAIATVIVVSFFVVYMKKQRQLKKISQRSEANESMRQSANEVTAVRSPRRIIINPGEPMFNSTMMDQEQVNVSTYS